MSTWVEREARRLQKARALLRPGVEGAAGTWADLGCGEGVFTYSLHRLLQPGSEIYAVDKKRRALQALTRNAAENYPEAQLQSIRVDFTQPLALPPLDGLVMANSLHFVKQKQPVLSQLINLLKPGGRLVVIEYNTRRGNYAVPYPLDEQGFLSLARDVGLQEVRILVKVPSSFLGEQYAGTGVASADQRR